MKVLHILDSLNRGGKETLVGDFALHGLAAGLEVTVLSMGTGPLQSEFNAVLPSYIQLTRRYPIDPGVVKGIRSVVVNSNFKIVHAHQAVEGIHAYLATLGLGVKCVLSFHGHTLKKKDEMTLRFLIPRVSANVAVSAAFLASLRDRAKSYREAEFTVVHNGLDPEKFVGGVGTLRHELQIDPSAILIGTVSNFLPGKDPLTICKALSAIGAGRLGVYFVFVGGKFAASARMYEECIEFCGKNGLSQNVLFLGQRNDVPNVLRSLDLFVFSSVDESFGLAPLEAMMSGVPVLMADLSPLREISADGKYAYLFGAGDSRSLANALFTALNDMPAMADMALSAKQWAQENFGIKAHVLKMKSLYARLLCAA
jgi:L-malate glycosyltransferase